MDIIFRLVIANLHFTPIITPSHVPMTKFIETFNGNSAGITPEPYLLKNIFYAHESVLTNFCLTVKTSNSNSIFGKWSTLIVTKCPMNNHFLVIVDENQS